ncbi:hypothetical protein B7463_g7967, partial [Scytalidium lignicola]
MATYSKSSDNVQVPGHEHNVEHSEDVSRHFKHSKSDSKSSIHSSKSHQEYLDSLVPPSPEQIRRISSVQERKEEEIVINRRLSLERPDLSDEERVKAATLIQRNYRGHRVRRQLQGLSVDATSRWMEAIKEARYRNLTTPRPRASLDVPTTDEHAPVNRTRSSSIAMQNWKKVGLIARRAGWDEDPEDEDEDEDVIDDDESNQSQNQHEEKLKRHAEEKAKRQKAAMIMDLQYFLEMVDLKHRYGSNLKIYHEEWKKSNTKENFFYWLDYGEGRFIDCQACPRERLERERVRYLSKEERLDYLVKIDDKGRLRWAKNGALIDTTTKFKDSIHGIVPIDDNTPAFSPAAEEAAQRDDTASEASGSNSSESSDEEADRAHRYADPEFDNAKGIKKVRHVSAATIFNKLLRGSVKKNTWIFVADTSFRLYVGIKQSGAFQHSSFLHGSRISAAGLIKIKDGRISKLSPLSGHYRPPVSNFRAFIQALKDAGADMSHVSISRSYAVLVGLEAYVKTRKRGKKIVEKIMHTRDKYLFPEDNLKHHEQETDKVNDNIVATTPPVNKPGHDNNLRQRANTGQKKRSIHTADLDEGPYDKKRARFAIEINSKPIVPPNTRPLVVRPHAPTTAAVPKNPDPQHNSKKPEHSPRQQTNHRQKITNGIKHELDRLQPSDADTKDEKRKLRSQEGARFKSELSAYFPEYDEVIGNEPKEDHFLNVDTPIIITDSAKPSGPKVEEPTSPKRKRGPSMDYSVKIYPDSLFDDLYDAQRVDFSFLDSHYKAGKQLKDPLPDEYFETVHRRPERQERAIRNSDKGRAQHEKDQVIRLLEGLQGHDWLKLMGVSGITESKKKEYEPAREHFIKGCEGILEKFRMWKEEERRRKQEREQAQAEASAEQEAEEEAEEDVEPEPEDDQGDLSDGDPPDYSDVDASAARQLHEEAIARSAPVPVTKRPRKRLKSEEHQETPPDVEKEFKSFFPKPYLREAALGKHRRSGRSVAAWGHPIPDVAQKNFDLPEEYLDEETLKANARRKRRKVESQDNVNCFALGTHVGISMPGLLLEMEGQELSAPRFRQYGFVVSHQKVELEIDFASQSLVGRTEITILPQSKDLRTIKVDAQQCVIQLNQVLVNNRAANASYEDPFRRLQIPKHYLWGAEHYEMQQERLKPLYDDPRPDGALEIVIPKTVRIEEVDPFSESAPNSLQQRALGASVARNSSIVVEGGINAGGTTPTTLTPKVAEQQSAGFLPITISIPFHTKNFRDGLQFVGLGEGDSRYPHVYTRHGIDPGTASSIFPCVDDPAMRCTWELSIKCAKTLRDALKKPRHHKAHPGKNHHFGNMPNGVNTVVSHDQDDIPLSDEDKLLDMTVVGPGEMVNDVVDLVDSSKKIVSFMVTTPVGPQHIGFAIGPFELVDLSEFREDEEGEKLGQGAVQVLGFCLLGRAEELRNTCAPMAHAIDYFSLNFGKYPFLEYKICFVDDMNTDTEHVASLSLCSSRLLFGEAVIDPEVENTRKLVHAAASQWIGVSIIPNQATDRWVVIGISQFITGLFMKSLCGNNEYLFRQKILTDQLVELDINRPSIYALGAYLHLGTFEQDFMTLKAPLVLFILDRRIAKFTGSAGLTRVISKIIISANTGGDSVLSTEGFRRSCEKTTKYRQTETFWNQWVLGAGCPRFSIAQRFNRKRMCVEMTISQKQELFVHERKPDQQKIPKSDFMRRFKEEANQIQIGEVQPVFTGPMTIRIHEADGTPYEHIIEIREGAGKIEIPYNTKYKRLKRSRRQKERATAGAGVDITAENQDDVLIYCLGDVLQSREEVMEWGLADWDAETEAKMDQESYEWIRIDADFEWLCEKTFVSMPAYMYVSQLQQDRDVTAQHESMVFLRNSPPHPLVATFLIRTLMDRRYFHGIRTMAAEILKTHATANCRWVGMKHLEKAFQEFFCYPGTKTPRANDFSDKKAYWVECAIPRAMAKIRNNDGKCPKEARHFILDQLRFNDNGNNEFSDNHYIANLLLALTDSLIPSKKISNELQFDDEEEDVEPKQFRDTVIEELDRYRRMDEWIHSYQNIYTTTVLDCKQRLMKAGVIPIDALEFAQYLHDGTLDLVRIKAFEALADLGLLISNSVSSLLLNILSTDPSTFVRHRLDHVLYYGMATVAFGEYKLAEPAVVEEDALVMDQSDQVATDRKALFERTTSVAGAVVALKDELGGDAVLKESIWMAIKSPVIDLGGELDLLDVCWMLYDSVESFPIVLRLPRYWKVKHLGKGKLVFKETGRVRTKPKPIYKPLTQAVNIPPQPLVRQPSKVIAALPKSLKRPAPPDSSNGTPPSKIIKLKINGSKLEAIQRSRANPTPPSAKVLPPPASLPAQDPQIVPQTVVSQQVRAPVVSALNPNPTASVSPTPPIKARKPLPDSAPPSLQRKPSIILKLKTKHQPPT